jgi:hypothetical protein
MRKRHHLGDEQIRALWEWTRSLKGSSDDMNFTPADLSAIRARTLIVQGRPRSTLSGGDVGRDVQGDSEICFVDCP